MRIGRLSMALVALVGGMAIVSLVSVSVEAQGAAPPGPPWTARTAWGDPDFQGLWTNWDFTPFEASDGPVEEVDPKTGSPGGLGGGMSSIYFGPVSPRRHAVVVDPPGGKVPHRDLPKPTRAQAMRLLGDHWKYHSLWHRCITMGALNHALLDGGISGYGKAYRLMQSPGYVVIFAEMIHEARFIPVGGRPHVGQNVRLRTGDSRGRWEGRTLVVETTNFRNEGQLGGGQQTDNLRLLERFERLDEKTMKYEVTVHDPTVFTQPWVGRQFHNLDPNYVMHEYACHEGNGRFMEGALDMGRLRDAEEAAKKTTK